MRAPAAAPPPIFTTLLLVWLLPLAKKPPVVMGVIFSIDFNRRESERELTGTCSRPLDLAYVTFPFTVSLPGQSLAVHSQISSRFALKLCPDRACRRVKCGIGSHRQVRARGNSFRGRDQRQQ